MARNVWTVTFGAVLLSAGLARAESLVVAAAASLREPVLSIVSEFSGVVGNPEALASFGASSVLARQIEAGAGVAVFLSADPRLVDRLEAGRHVRPGSRFAFASNRLVVLASERYRGPVRGPADLFLEGVRIALPAAPVPVGRYARVWLGSHGLASRLEERSVRTEHARATLAAVDGGHVDLAIVYATDARVARSARVVLEIPPDEQPEISYVAVATWEEPAGADRFLQFLASRAARAHLERAGFTPVVIEP